MRRIIDIIIAWHQNRKNRFEIISEREYQIYLQQHPNIKIIKIG